MKSFRNKLAVVTGGGSGMGRELGEAGLASYTELKTVTLNLA